MTDPDAFAGLHTDFTVTTHAHIPDLERLQRFLFYAAARERMSGELGIWLCTDDEIADLHLRFMDIPGATDVITFPGNESYVGDIAVSVDTAAGQAEDVGHSPEREVAYLCLHGLLHIAGYDDQDDESRRRMIERQETLLHAFEQSDQDEW